MNLEIGNILWFNNKYLLIWYFLSRSLILYIEDNGLFVINLLI